MSIRKKKCLLRIIALFAALAVIHLLMTNVLKATARPLCTAISEQTNLRSFCAEKFMGTLFGYPFFRKGHERTNCSKAAMWQLVTVILDNPCVGKPECSTRNILDSIHRLHENTTTLVVQEGVTAERARVINEMVCNVRTPFVFIAANLAEFDNNVNLERLIDVIESGKNVVAAGSAVRNALNGEWSSSCLQIKLQNFTLLYENGYNKSHGSCLVCDVLRGPFLTRTRFLRQLKFREDFRKGFYEDWFLRLNPRRLDRWKNPRAELKGLAVSCPDVMSSIYSEHIPDSDLSGFAADWEIKKIITAEGTVKWFGCRRGIKHRLSKCNFHQGMSVPPCCLENLADAIKFLMRTCELNSITCELQEGTLLGAVKFQKVLPWERDADITFLTADFEKLKKLQTVFANQGYSLQDTAQPWCCADGIHAGGVFMVSVDGWTIEMYGQHIMDSYERFKQGKPPSKLWFAGQLVNVPDNPGSFARNRYGKEIYRHAEHWMVSSHKSGWENYSPGTFQKCGKPGHHGCLDQYEADGNLQFRVKGITGRK